jgi:hypothetical protein
MAEFSGTESVYLFLPCSLPGPCARIPAKCTQVIVFAFTWDFWFKIPSTRVGAFVCEGADPGRIYILKGWRWAQQKT